MSFNVKKMLNLCQLYNETRIYQDIILINCQFNSEPHEPGMAHSDPLELSLLAF